MTSAMSVAMSLMQELSGIVGRAAIIAVTKLASKVGVNHQRPEIGRLQYFFGTVPLGADMRGIRTTFACMRL